MAFNGSITVQPRTEYQLQLLLFPFQKVGFTIAQGATELCWKHRDI